MLHLLRLLHAVLGFEKQQLIDFRMIPLGDIDLQHEIRLGNGTGVVGRRSRGTCVRRMYSAKIHGKMSNMTVALYLGDKAEGTWGQDTSRVSELRHPNLVQIYGAARASRMYATIFHDDLVPYQRYLDLYRHSSILTIYIWAFCEREWSVQNKTDFSIGNSLEHRKPRNICTLFSNGAGRLGSAYSGYVAQVAGFASTWRGSKIQSPLT
ncbi:hypothetical protein C8R43DRAFT_530072 [Mycena crocata]|nr:hypothetical protein C8R43DRAFT_530072 [Mycena crocata]